MPLAKVRFIEPMYALAVQKIPDGKDRLYEVKFDGYRCLASRDMRGFQCSAASSIPRARATLLCL